MNNHKEKELRTIFKLLEDKGVQHLVLRGFNEIPDKVTYSNDLDLLCLAKDKDKLSKIFKELGYSFYSDSKLDYQYFYMASPHYHFLDKKKDIHIDVVFNLSYRSPNKGEWVSVHQEVQDSIWLNKTSVDQFWKYQASYLDEFTHLVCHSIFDKKEFREKDINRINEIYQYVDKEKLLYLFKFIFYRYSQSLLDQIEKREFENILSNYLKFKDY